MNLRNLPYWLKYGLMLGAIGTAIFLLLGKDVSNLAYTPWYAAWFILPAFLIFAIICIIFGVDFVSNTADKGHIILLSSLWIISIFLTFFIIGSVIGLLAGFKKNRRPKNRRPA